VAEAFYERTRRGYRPSELTRGPWSPDSQHAGPPAALLGREIEALEDAAEFRLGRITFEILRPVPIAELSVTARVVRPGRRVQMAEAALSDSEGEVLIARAWLLRIAEVDVSSATVPEAEAMLGPAHGEERPFFPIGGKVAGYHTAMEQRFLEGGFTEPGPARVWMRMGHQLVAGEDPTPLQRVLIVADSGNGVSAALDFRRFLFINVELTVHLERLPRGEWVGLDSVTWPQPDGTGTTDTDLHDPDGTIGSCTADAPGGRALLVDEQFHAPTHADDARLPSPDRARRPRACPRARDFARRPRPTRSHASPRTRDRGITHLVASGGQASPVPSMTPRRQITPRPARAIPAITAADKAMAAANRNAPS